MTMTHDDVLETLAKHADELNKGMILDIENLGIAPERKEEAVSLLQLAERVKKALVPVQPAPTYRQKLGRELSVVARQRMSKDVIIARPSPPRDLLVGAAVALVGGIAYFIRTRARPRDNMSASV